MHVRPMVGRGWIVNRGPAEVLEDNIYEHL